MSVSSIYGCYSICISSEEDRFDVYCDFGGCSYHYMTTEFKSVLVEWKDGDLKGKYINSTDACSEMHCLDGEIVEVYRDRDLLTKFWLSDLLEYFEVIDNE